MIVVDIAALAETLSRRAAGDRLIVALAGPPGAGKSTAAAAIAARLDRDAPGSAAVLPMDGFHLDDRVLDGLGLLARKGAPETFDAAGLAHMLGRLRRNAEPAIAVPVFDRDLEIARAGASLVPREVRIVLVEGNYLLLGAPPWSGLHDLFDVTVMVDASEEVLRRRLEERWRGYGLSPEAIRAKVEGNDLPNGRLVRAHSIAAEFRLPT